MVRAFRRRFERTPTGNSRRRLETGPCDTEQALELKGVTIQATAGRNKRETLMRLLRVSLRAPRHSAPSKLNIDAGHLNTIPDEPFRHTVSLRDLSVRHP